MYTLFCRVYNRDIFGISMRKIGYKSDMGGASSVLGKDPKPAISKLPFDSVKTHLANPFI